MDKDLSEFPIQFIKGVGPRRAKLAGRLGIHTVRDALYYLPYRFEDRKSIKNICRLNCGALETAVGKVVSADVIRLPRSRMNLFELAISDGTGVLKGKWFNQPFMQIAGCKDRDSRALFPNAGVCPHKSGLRILAFGGTVFDIILKGLIGLLHAYLRVFGITQDIYIPSGYFHRKFYVLSLFANGKR